MSRGALNDEGYVSSIPKGLWKLGKEYIVMMKDEECCALYRTQVVVCTKKVELKYLSREVNVASLLMSASSKVEP